MQEPRKLYNYERYIFPFLLHLITSCITFNIHTVNVLEIDTFTTQNTNRSLDKREELFSFFLLYVLCALFYVLYSKRTDSNGVSFLTENSNENFCSQFFSDSLSHDRKARTHTNVQILEMCEMWEFKGGKIYFSLWVVWNHEICKFFIVISSSNLGTQFLIILRTINCNTVLVFQCWIAKDDSYSNQQQFLILRSTFQKHYLLKIQLIQITMNNSIKKFNKFVSTN